MSTFHRSRRQNRWLWYPYIPYGKLTILQGDPGEGKSTFILNIAALLTRGKNMPDGFRVPSPQRVVYQTAEDNIADTVKPRLIEAGADCDMIAYIVDDDIPLTLEDSRIEKVIEQTGARLFILIRYRDTCRKTATWSTRTHAQPAEAACGCRRKV